jgi:glycerate 2-kinase
MRTTHHRQSILIAFKAGIEAAHPGKALDRYCQRDGDTLVVGRNELLELDGFGRIWLLGAGKASHSLATAAYRLLAGRVAGGSIATRDPGGTPIAGITLFEAGHPYPDVSSVAAADDALRIARSCAADDLVLCLLSGGASSLWAAPPAGVSLADLRAVTTDLLRAGVPIAELNTVRKHLSRIAGGRLARACNRARILTVAVSDVIDAGLDTIGSGPTLPDTTTAGAALDIMRDRNIAAPDSVLRYLRKEAATEEYPAPDTARDDYPYGTFHVIASVGDALEGAAKALATLGYEARVVSRILQGEAREVAAQIVDAAIGARTGVPTALLWGGETTVTVKGQGKGGRNQELALAAALRLLGQEEITIASLATDGSDGPTESAGAFADAATVARGVSRGLNAALALENNDSHEYLTAVGDAIVTAPTGTNVNDLVFALLD